MIQMHMLRLFLIAALLIVPVSPGPQQSDVSGVAFVDANGNGVRETGERGLANVVLSNQDACRAGRVVWSPATS